MSLLDSIAAKLGYVRAGDGRMQYAPTSSHSIDAPLFLRDDADMSRFSIPDGSVVYNQADLFRRLSWLQGAVLVTAQTAAVTPFSVKRRVGEELRDIPNHPLELLLSNPNPMDSQFELLESTFAYRRLCRNAYWWLNRESPDAPPDEIWPIPPYKIQPIPDGKQYLAGYAFYPEGMWGSTWQERPMYPLRTWEVVHFRGFNPISRFVGMSPVEALAQVAQGDLQEQAYNTNFFGENNAKIPGALAFKQMINNTDWRTIKQDLREQFAGVERSGPLMLRGVGEGGVEWLKMGLTQEEMQFLESRDFTKREIYDLVAPGLANVMDASSSMANASVGKAAFIEFSIYPDQKSVGEKVTKDILPSYDRRGRSLVGAFDDIRVTDQELRFKEIDAYAKYHTTAEVRKKYYDGGDLPKPAGASPAPTNGQTNGHSHEPIPKAVKAASLLPDEAPIFASLVTLGAAATADSLRELLTGALAPIMIASLAENAPQIGAAAASAPAATWIADYVALALPPLLAALHGGPGPGDDWGWLIRMVVTLVVRARAYVTRRLADWANQAQPPDSFPSSQVAIVWVVQRDLLEQPDSRVCVRCAALDGMPSDLWADINPQASEGPPLHGFCRCRTRLVALDAVASSNGRH